MTVHDDPDLKALLRPLTEDERADLRIKLMRDGCMEALPYAMINGKAIQLDGHHRRAICDEEQIPYDWRLVEFVTTKAEAVAWVKEHQRGRRNLSAEELDRLREERRERVAEARQQGMSTRAIAEKEGVSQKTVRNDLKASTEQGCSVEPESGKVVSRDGKMRPATVETRPIPTREKKERTNGKPSFNLRECTDAVGLVMKRLDDLARCFNVDGRAQRFEEIRTQLRKVNDDVRSLYTAVSRRN